MLVKLLQLTLQIADKQLAYTPITGRPELRFCPIFISD